MFAGRVAELARVPGSWSVSKCPNSGEFRYKLLPTLIPVTLLVFQDLDDRVLLVLLRGEQAQPAAALVEQGHEVVEGVEFEEPGVLAGPGGGLGAALGAGEGGGFGRGALGGAGDLELHGASPL